MNAIAPEILYPVGAALLALVIGVLIGRAGRASRRQIEELEVRVAERDGQIDQLEAARVELEAHRTELGIRLLATEQERDENRDRLTHYQAQVVSHFGQTSDLLKEMTLQYRGIYQHLAEGAETLCPDGALKLEKQTPIDGLLAQSDASPEGEPALETDLGEDSLEALEEAREESPFHA